MLIEVRVPDSNISFWSGKRICVTGGAGFLGRRVVEQLRARGCGDIFVPRSSKFNLTDRTAVCCMYDAARPDIVIHLAAVVGGIGANRDNPGRFFYENLMMGAHLIDEGRLRGIAKFVCTGTVCAYPKYTPVPFKEDDLWNGYPEETNAPYGIAKRALLTQCQAYRQQYGFNGIFLLPVNLYGPFDNFDLSSSHVIPAVIRKCVEAQEEGKSSVTMWGTGTVSREFLYVEDCAEAIVLATERYNQPEPVNVGVGREVTIQDLVKLIAELVGFRGEIVYDPNKPDGQPRRMLDTSRAEREFGFRAKTTLEQGLQRTIAWYREQHSSRSTHA
jgi:GDP-L-fucose synthase